MTRHFPDIRLERLRGGRIRQVVVDGVPLAFPFVDLVVEHAPKDRMIIPSITLTIPFGTLQDVSVDRLTSGPQSAPQPQLGEGFKVINRHFFEKYSSPRPWDPLGHYITAARMVGLAPASAPDAQEGGKE